MKSFLLLYLIVLMIYPALSIAQGQSTQPVDINIQREDVILKGKLYPAGKDSISPTLILLHGFPGNETDVLGLGSNISRVGFNVLTFNYSGTYQSTGEWNFENTQQDIRAAYNFLH